MKRKLLDIAAIFFGIVGNALEKALIQVNREDVVQKTMYNVEVVQDEIEAAAARAAMDQSGGSFQKDLTNCIWSMKFC